MTPREEDKPGALPSAPSNLRSFPALQPLRQRRNAVVVCRDDAQQYEVARSALARLNAELIVEAEPGPLSTALGRPSVTVCDRYLDFGLHERAPSLDRVLGELELFELSCPECPQAADELQGR
jgi:hypothetical protein